MVPAADSGAGAGIIQFLPILVVFGIFYFLLILPQQRQRRKTQEMLASLKTGDRVLTSGGIYGTVVGFRGNIVQLQIANQVKIEVARAAISGLDTREGEGQTEGSAGREPARKDASGKDQV